MSSATLKSNVRYALVDHFSPYMGIHKQLDRSEIVTVVRQVPGVIYCEVRKPSVDLRFDYDIKDLTQVQLLDYTPQYIGFISGKNMYSSGPQDDGIQIEIVS
jgi:hypothetical protein